MSDSGEERRERSRPIRCGLASIHSRRSGVSLTSVASSSSEELQSLGSKEHFLRYAGRYARRPPIAQRRITGISGQEIAFWAKDRRLRRQVMIRLTPKDFLAAWAQHRYSSAAVFAILGQSPKRRPRPLSWNLSINRDFGWDPLLDRQGNRMAWSRRIAPQSAQPSWTAQQVTS